MIKKLNAVKVIVAKPTGVILLLKRGPTAPRRALEWDLPGGVVDDGEEALGAAIRELEEETAIIASVDYHHSQHEIKVSETLIADMHYYTTEVIDSTVTVLSYEHIDYVWVTPQEAIQLLEFNVQKEALKKIYNLSSEA